ARWFSLPNLFWFLPVPILVLVTFYALLRSVANNDHVKPFVLTLVLIFLGYSGLGISLWPNIIPPAVSIWEASA
ncbi:cytochrome d ubiquinol oxidase subunit II, partial [Klebsiella pneumoniae]